MGGFYLGIALNLLQNVFFFVIPHARTAFVKYALVKYRIYESTSKQPEMIF